MQNKKFYNIVIIIVLLTILSVFVILALFRSEEEGIETDIDVTIHEINANWQIISLSPIENSSDEKYEETIGPVVSLPYSGKSEPNEIIVFQTTIPPGYGGLTLSFHSKESVVRVSLNETIIYQYGVDNQRMFGKSPGSRMNFVDLPEYTEDAILRIELVSSYKDAAATLDLLSVSEKDVAIMQLIESNLLNLFSCLLVLICAVVFLILGIVSVRTGQNTHGVFWMSALSLDVGLYYLFKTEMLSVFFGARAVYYIGQYLFIMLIPLFLLLYLEKDLKNSYPKSYVTLFTVINLNIFAQLILQLTNILDLADTVKYTAILFRGILAVCVFLYVRSAIKDRKKRCWFMASIFTVLMIGELVAVCIGAPIDVQGYKTYSLYAMTLFLFVLAGYHVIKMTKEQRAEAEESARLALAASEAKGKFLANMSHEIRTPLNAVLGMDEMILREAKEPKIREYAMDIFTAGQMLLSLINDILDLSKIESGKMEIIQANYDVSSMIHDLANMTEMRAKKKNLNFYVEADREIPGVLYGDDVRIRQVVTNILTNAVKYTREGEIRFRIRLEKKEAGKATLYFEVEDTGIGIKEDDLPKLYTEFERIEESRNRNIEGTGLGMSITLQLLQMMGSRLKVESVYGKGSKFSFYLEQDIADEKPIGDFQQNVQQLAAKYTYAAGFTAAEAEVLVVDDNAINRKVFGNLLNQTQVKITEADSGYQCLELTKQKHFDIIFLDHMMPELDGVQTLKKLKDDPENLCKDVPVIALTANAVSGAKKHYLELGFTAYLSKPIVSEKLEKILLEYLPKELIKETEKTEDLQLRETAAEKPDLEQLPMVEGLDWNYVWLHLSEMDLLKSTTEAFYEQIPSAAEKLDSGYREICESGGLQSYRIQVHAMKSLAATLGILPLAGMAKVLEDAAKNEQPEIIHNMHKIFLKEWNSYREKLVGVFGITASEDKAEPEDSSVICALLEMVSIAIQEMDIDEADEKMKMICSYRYKDGVQKNVELLRTAVENLDPGETEKYVRIIINQLSEQKESVQ